MLSCKDVSQLASQELDRPLGAGERLSLRIHLLMCDGCRNFTRQMNFIREAARRFRTNPPIDDA